MGFEDHRAALKIRFSKERRQLLRRGTRKPCFGEDFGHFRIRRVEEESALSQRCEIVLNLRRIDQRGFALQLPVEHFGDKNRSPARVSDDEIRVFRRVPRLQRRPPRDGQPHRDAEAVGHRDGDTHTAVGSRTESDDDAADTTTESGTGATGEDAGTSESDADTTDGTGTNATTVQTATPANPESATPAAGDRAAKIETVISRAMSQVGVPYAWGGGDANGPTKGIRDGGNADAHGDYNKIGFDCSGLTLYAYAGIGISLPHYTGYQYQRGTHHPASQMQRGDLIFYGPNGHGHVAIYLGNGQMIEAPQSGSTVRVTAVRYNGMTPNVVRLV